MLDDNDEISEDVLISTITFSVQKLDRGSYTLLSIYSSDLNDPIGSLTFTKGDPNHDRKIELFKSSITWLNSYLKGESGKS